MTSTKKREGDDGFAGLSGFFDQLFFKFVWKVHLTGGDLVVGGFDEAELAAGEGITFGYADGRAEDATGHGSPCVDIAEAGVSIEGGASCVVGEVFEAGLIVFRCAEDSGCGVAGVIGGVLVDPGMSAGSNRFGFVWIGGEEGLHAGVETGSIKRVDGEDAVTALGASRAAG
jgi:hypothetical protein